MVVTLQAHYAVCVDCFDVHMGWLDNLDEETIERCDAALKRVAKRGYWQEGSEEEDQEFTWRACEVCDSPLGGQRKTLSRMTLD